MEVEDGIDGGFQAPPPTLSPSADIFVDKGQGNRTDPKPPVPPVKGADKGKGKGAAPEEKKKCKGCLKLMPLSEFPVNSVFCFKDKRALDVISKQSHANDDAYRFYQTARQDPEQVVKLLATYHRVTPASDGRKAKSQFNVMQYMEQTVAESSIMVRATGKFMNEDEYKIWAQNAERGSAQMSKSQAADEWTRMVADESVLKQHDKGVVSCEVYVGTFINRDHTVRNLKTMTLKEKEKKK